MKLKKYLLLGIVAVVVAAVALVGCSSNQQKSEGGAQQSSGDVVLVTPGTLTVLTEVPYPPFEYNDPNTNEIVGLDIEIMQAVADKLGYTLVVKNMDFDGIIPALQAGGQGDIGAAGISVKPDRAEQIDFTSTYLIDDQSVIVMENSPINEDNVVESLNTPDAKIAVQLGTTSEDYVRENFPQATIVPYKMTTDAFAALQAGQANAVCINSNVAKRMIAGAYSDTRVVMEIATGEEYAFAISKDNPELSKAVNAALAELISDGTIDSLVNKYMTMDIEIVE